MVQAAPLSPAQRWYLCLALLAFGALLVWVSRGQLTGEASALEARSEASSVASSQQDESLAHEPEESKGNRSPSSVSAEGASMSGGDEDSMAGDHPAVLYKSSLTYLEEYWGQEWPERLAQLRKYDPVSAERYENLVLTEDLIPPPLSEIHEDIQRLLLEEFDRSRAKHASRVGVEEWPEIVTSELLPPRLGLIGTLLNEEDIASIQRVADEYRAEVAKSRESFLGAARDVVIREAQAGGYTAWPLLKIGAGKSPGSPQSPEPRLGDSLISLTISRNGLWIISLRLSSTQHPYLGELASACEEIGERRLRAARGALR